MPRSCSHFEYTVSSRSSHFVSLCLYHRTGKRKSLYQIEDDARVGVLVRATSDLINCGLKSLNQMSAYPGNEIPPGRLAVPLEVT